MQIQTQAVILKVNQKKWAAQQRLRRYLGDLQLGAWEKNGPLNLISEWLVWVLSSSLKYYSLHSQTSDVWVVFNKQF